jgi:hypothetical protein
MLLSVKMLWTRCRISNFRKLWLEENRRRYSETSGICPLKSNGGEYVQQAFHVTMLASMFALRAAIWPYSDTMGTFQLSIPFVTMLEVHWLLDPFKILRSLALQPSLVPGINFLCLLPMGEKVIFFCFLKINYTCLNFPTFSAYQQVEIVNGVPTVKGWKVGKVVQRAHRVSEREDGVFVVSFFSPIFYVFMQMMT